MTLHLLIYISKMAATQLSYIFLHDLHKKIFCISACMLIAGNENGTLN